jgi:hypothetical protein
MQKRNVAEAVFKHLFQHNSSALKDKAQFYALSLFGSETIDDDFLARFRGAGKPVIAAAESRTQFGKGVILPSDTTAQGLLFKVVEVVLVSEDSARAVGGIYENEISSSGHRFGLSRQEGKWKVSEDEMDWISGQPANSWDWASLSESLRRR